MSIQLPIMTRRKSVLGWIVALEILANCSASIAQRKTDFSPTAFDPLSIYERERGLAIADQIRSESERQSKSRRKPSSQFDLNVSNDQLAKIRAETQTYRTQIESIERQIKTIDENNVEREKLASLTISYERDRTKVRHYLGALFAPGFTQPDPRSGIKHKVTSKKGPVSLTALREFGALDENERGLFKLGYAGSDPTNDRNRRSFPKHVGGSLETKEVEILKPAQELLIKYQKLLVDEGLLAP